MLRLHTSYDPWREFRALQRQMDDVFQGLLPEAGRSGHGAGAPSFNVSDRGDVYVLEAELPGVDQNHLSIEATAFSITIKGRRDVATPQGYTAHRRERGSIEFARSFNFDSKLDLEKVSAKLNDGILRVELGKAPDAKPRQIAISGT
jgi:HSP20 family protein